MDINGKLDFYAHLIIFFGAIFWLTVALRVAKRFAFFNFREEPLNSAVSFWQMVGAFAVFLTIQMVLLPLVLIAYMGGPTAAQSTSLGAAAQGWFNVGGMLFSSVGVILFGWIQPPAVRLLIWQRGEKKGWEKNIFGVFSGVLSWLLCYPMVLIVGQVIGFVMYYCFGIEEVEQVPVKHIRAAAEIPILYFSMIFSIIFVIPVMEELLFRGFLHTWLRSKWNLKTSILITSAIFAIFHFSVSQSFSNIQYLVALFLLSCFLGYLYEKRKTLWAPIGLHMTFNGISLAILHLY